MTKTVCEPKTICSSGFAQLDVASAEIFIHYHRLEKLKMNNSTGNKTLYVYQTFHIINLFYLVVLCLHLLHTN
jgi:hypothetical protein